ncbi:MAG: TolC family protein [Akkermansia sp.]
MMRCFPIVSVSPLVLVSLVMMSSCMVGPDFQKPGNDLPATWSSNVPPHSSMNDLREWWGIFGDSQLTSLINKAVSDNPDMRIALLRVRESRASAKIAGATLLPTLGAGVGATRSSLTGLTDSSSRGSFSHSENMSWELDVFGGNRRAIEAAEANLLSSEANALAVRTALLAEVTITYFTWIANCEQLRVAREQLDIQKRTKEIVRNRKRVGFAADLDWQQAISQVASTEGNLPILEANMKASKNSLSILLGSYLANLSLRMPGGSVFGKMPDIPMGLPSDLLRRRPDIIAAEADLHAAVAEIGVSVADMYPKFSLSGSLSGGGTRFFDAFTNHAGAWGVGGEMSQALYRGGELRERVQKSKAAAQRVSEAYRKVLVNAVGEVERALIDYGSYRQKLVFIEQENVANKKAAELALELYTEGKTDFLNVATAQRAWLSSEEAIVVLKQNIRQSVASLAVALGGGW